MAEIKNIETDKVRVQKVREYLFDIIDNFLTDKNYQINADMLSNNPNNYSIDKIPTSSTIEEWITGSSICRDVFSFRSRMHYSQDVLQNLINVGFFEKFEQIIKNNNEKGILPDIKGIENIECLNCGSMNSSTTNTAEFDIQLQISYRKED